MNSQLSQVADGMKRQAMVMPRARTCIQQKSDEHGRYKYDMYKGYAPSAMFKPNRVFLAVSAAAGTFEQVTAP